MLGRPDVVWGGFCKEIGPVGGFRPLDTFKVTKLGLSSDCVGGGGLNFFGFMGGLGELFSKGGQERGPPSLGFWGGARARRSCLYRPCERGKGRGEPLVELVGRGSFGGGRDLPFPTQVSCPEGALI